jgi:hypothetical protein
MLPPAATCEGCVFERGASATATIATPATVQAFLYNSRSADMPLGELRWGLLANSALPGDPRLVGQAVALLDGAASVLLPGTPNPVPQLLFGTAFR